jgi:selenium metabolism protein YedF
MRIVDTKGQLCPAPLIATKRALKEAFTGEVFLVLTDNKTSRDNLVRFLEDNKTEFSIKEDNDVWTLKITKGIAAFAQKKEGDYCTAEIPHFTQGNFVIVFSSDKMGEGDDGLGHILLTTFIKAIKDLDILPKKIVFYNKGVTLGSEGSPVLEDLKEIEKMGVGLLLCATCVRFYSLEEKIRVGSLSNMFEIAHIMASAGNIIKP